MADEQTPTPPPATPPAETPLATPPVETPAETPPAAAEPPSILGDKPPEVAAPIEYKDFTVPEGFELDAEALPAVKTLFSELKLDQAGAQRLITTFAENAQNLVKAVETEAAEEWNALRADWTKTIENDPDIGGAKLPGVRANISKLFDRLEIPGLRDSLKLTGADNNPDIVKSYAKVAAMLTEGQFISGDVPKPTPRTTAQALYPTGPSHAMQGRPDPNSS